MMIHAKLCPYLYLALFTLVFQPWEFQLFSWFCLWSQASRLPIFLSNDQTLGHLRETFILHGRLWKKKVPETPPKQKNIILRWGGTVFGGVTKIWETMGCPTFPSIFICYFTYTLHGRSPAPPGMYKTLGANYIFTISAGDFFHQQYF